MHIQLLHILFVRHLSTEPVQELSLWKSSECESECGTEAHCRRREDCRCSRQSLCCPVTLLSSSSRPPSHIVCETTITCCIAFTNVVGNPPRDLVFFCYWCCVSRIECACCWYCTDVRPLYVSCCWNSLHHTAYLKDFTRLCVIAVLNILVELNALSW